MVVGYKTCERNEWNTQWAYWLKSKLEKPNICRPLKRSYFEVYFDIVFEINTNKVGRLINQTKHFPVVFVPYFFKPRRLKYQLFISDIPVFKKKKFPYFFKLQRLIYQLLAFLVHDVIKHFPVLFSHI